MSSRGGLVPCLVCALALGTSACGTWPALRPSAPLRQAASSEERARVLDWLERVRGERQERSSLRAYARVRLTGEAGRARARQVIVAERPRRLRVETVNFLGITQSLLVVDDGESSLFDGRDLVTDQPPGLLLAQIGLDLAPEEALDLLLVAPDLPRGAPEDVWVSGDERVAAFEGLEVSFAPDGMLRGVDAIGVSGDLFWSVEYDRWSEVEGGRYPLAIRAWFPRTELLAEIALEDVELNAQLDRALFRVAPSPR